MKFDVSLKSSKLTKTYHYNSQQQRLYDVVKELHEIKGFGYRRISDFLINEGFRTIQSNKPILPNYVYSIYKKGKIRENRINREFDSYYHNIRLFVNWSEKTSVRFNRSYLIDEVSCNWENTFPQNPNRSGFYICVNFFYL